jgi:outer membrane receptor protein involved in Fe transport
MPSPLKNFITLIFALIAIVNLNAQSTEEKGVEDFEVESTLKIDAATDVDELFYEMSEFEVSASDDQGYYSANSSSATRANTLVKNTPITMSIVNEQLINDLDIQSTEDLAMVVSGIESDPDGYSLDRVRIRGFRVANSRFEYFPRNLPRNNYNVNRVDVIKGANSLIFGQASPGGSVNTITQVGNFNKDSEVLSFGIGSKGYTRGYFNANKILNDKVAVKIIGVRLKQGYDQAYKKNSFYGGTVAVTYKPSKDTNIRLHLEAVDTETRFPSRSMKDATKSDVDNLFDTDTTNDGYNGLLSRYNYEVPYTADYVRYLPEAVVDQIVANSSTLNSRDDIAALYDGIDADNYGAATGPDKMNDRGGYFAIASIQHKFSNALDFELALSRQEINANGLTRDSSGAGRVKRFFSLPYDGKNPKTQYDAGEPYVSTYWTKNEWQGERNGAKTTFIYDQDFEKSNHKIIGGVDYDNNYKNAREYDMIPLGAMAVDGSYAGLDRLNNFRFTDQQRSYEYFGIDSGFDASVPGITFDYETSSNLDLLPLDGNTVAPNYTLSNDFTLPSYDGTPDSEWGVRRTQSSQVQTFSQWMAVQSEFMDGRLRTLIGARYDKIKLDSRLRKVIVDGYETDVDDGNNNETSAEHSKVSPSIGALYWINRNVGVFANYAESIESPVGTERTPLGDVAPPEYGMGYEGGIRFSLVEGRLDGQLVFYNIEKENDNEFNYTLGMLKEIYPMSIYGDEFPEIYYSGGGLKSGMLPGRRAVGDVTISRGIELDMTYNPSKAWTFFGSYNYALANTVKDLHPSISDEEQLEFFYNGDELLGRPSHRASITARYKFLDGALKNLSMGVNQSWRSPSMLTFFILPDGSQYPLYLGHELTTNLFVGHQFKLKKGRNTPRYNINLNINNIFDNTDLINRGNYAFYKEGRAIRFTVKVTF